MQLTKDDLKKILNIGIMLTTVRNQNHLLSYILENGMEITHCDASTLYLLEDNVLVFKIMKTLSQNVSKGVNGEKIDMPPVQLNERNVCAYAAIHGEIINIPDVYDSRRFDFSGPKKYDALTGYHTQSMLVIPLVDAQDQIIGVLQLLNAMDENGNIIEFDEEYEIIIRSIGSIAAISLTNLNYVEEITLQQYSFVEAMATVIDERTPYNGLHTRKVVEYVSLLADYINIKHDNGECEEYFDATRKDKLVLAAFMHDFGKVVIPLSVMNRATRLDGDIDKIEERFKLISAYYKIDFLEKRLDAKQYEEKISYLNDSLDFICTIDSLEFLSDECYNKVQEIAGKEYIFTDGSKLSYLTDKEKEHLSIIRGTLTDSERLQMESHVEMTAKILSKVHFSKNYKDVPKWAVSHHELLDGSGYPNHLKADNLDIETRMITIADIYDALTASDRPYKKPINVENSFGILRDMAKEGKIELRLVEWLAEAIEQKAT